jgi:2-keto-4-pentenoate hydratase
METMEDAMTREAARILWSNWRSGTKIPALPSKCRPETRADGYAVQVALQTAADDQLFGWKIAATSKAGQSHIGVDGPLGGRLLAKRASGSGAVFTLAGNQMRVAEPEFAFRMARSLHPRPSPYTTEEVLDAVASLHSAIEVPDSRYEQFTKVGAAQLIADNACAHYFVLGAAASNEWRVIDLVDHKVNGLVDGRVVGQGKGANVLGDPRVALTWLANELSGLGIGIEAGHVVTTGTCMTPIKVVSGNHVVADFGALGKTEVRFSN